MFVRSAIEEVKIRNVSNPRETVTELVALLQNHFGAALSGLYLFGSLAAGGFVPGKSDVDLLAVLDHDVGEGDELAALSALHADFVARYPEWSDRVEVGYVSAAVLSTFGDAPAGRIAVVSPGEPLNVKDAGADWVLNWHGVCTAGETLAGPPPLMLGPVVTPAAYRRAVETLLQAWATEVRAPWVAYVPAHQGYVAVTVCRALHLLETGKQATKEDAAAWAAERYPAWAAFIDSAVRRYRADVHGPHEETIRFVDDAVAEAGLLLPKPPS